MLSFACFFPHPPIIIPGVGKENLKLVKKTINAAKKLNQEILKIKPDISLIVSPHGLILPEAFVLNLSPKYQGNFEAFGDFTTKLEFKGNPDFAYYIRRELSKTFPISIVTQKELDHGCLVPLYYLTNQLENFSLLPISYSFLDYKTHFEFGKALKELIFSSNKKIAFIASGDLSHRLTFDAPAGYSPSGRIFDEHLIKYLRKKAIKQIVGFDYNLAEEAGECGLRSLLILLGLLDEVNYQPEILSYEGPFGVGYLVVNFKL